MKTRITKIVSLISILSILCLMVASCGSNSKPAYLLMCGEDNGLVAAYRAYFSLDGTTVQKVHEDRFNNLVGRSGDYTLINQTTYSFTAEAKSSNVSKWVFTESQYDKETYDVDQLIKYLKKMEVYYTGDIEIQIATFDSYDGKVVATKTAEEDAKEIVFEITEKITGKHAVYFEFVKENDETRAVFDTFTHD